MSWTPEQSAQFTRLCEEAGSVPGGRIRSSVVRGRRREQLIDRDGAARRTLWLEHFDEARLRTWLPFWPRQRGW